ncbi:MAG: class II fructose-bisphosphate aldolase [Candidatus Syntropharchaeales archaeon]
MQFWSSFKIRCNFDKNSGKQILDEANSESYALGAFNINNRYFRRSIIEATESERSPFVIAVVEAELDFEHLIGQKSSQKFHCAPWCIKCTRGDS